MAAPGATGFSLALAIALACVAPAPGAADCEPWPGEPTPLPSVDDSDPLRAEWAVLRSRELAEVARRLESVEPLRASQMWRHLLCIDPAHDQALAGVLRARAVRVYRPLLRDAPFTAARVGDPWSALDAPLGVATDLQRDAAEASILARLRELRGEVGTLAEHVRSARFDAALQSAPALRARLERAPRGATRTRLTAQAEVLAATAELALGRRSEAQASLRRALAADPNLSLDPATTSPKVVRALEEARAGSTP